MTEQDLKDTIIRQATEITELKAQLSNSQFLEKYYRDLHWELKCEMKGLEEKEPTTQDVADALGVSFDAASRVMAQPDFPLVVPGQRRNRKVNKHRFLTWMRTGE